MDRIAPTAALALVTLSLASGCAGPVQISLSAAADSAPADGVSSVLLTAIVDPPSAADVLSFQLTGAGLLAASNVPVIDGRASVPLLAPSEVEFAGPSIEATVAALLPLEGGLPLSAEAAITFTVPTEGPPLLRVRAEPDRVLAGGGQPIRLLVEGRRLSSQQVTLTASAPLAGLPDALALDGGEGALRTGAVEVPAAAQRSTVTVTIAGGGAPPVQVELRFIAEGDPEFDLSGDFVQVTYGAKRISDFGLLKNDPDCVSAAALSLMHVEQQGSELVMTSESCAVEMPAVQLIFDVTIAPQVTPAFIAATNAKSPGPLAFSLPSVEAGAAFSVPAAALAAPLIVGATLSDPAEALPTDENDDRESDDDGDGAPGVTIPGDGGLIPDTHMCFRTRTIEMSGAIESSDVLTGSVDTVTESVVFGGSFGSPTIEDVPSPFVMLRVDGRNGADDIRARAGDAQAVGCDDVKMFSDELRARFPAPPAVCE